jgi:prolycopene isomerase
LSAPTSTPALSQPSPEAGPAARSAPPWDVVVIGAGIGGLVTASQLAAKGAKVLVLERYLIPGGSGGSFRRAGYTFDVGASMIFGFGERGHTNLLTRALAAVDQRCDTVPDPAQLEYHLPGGLTVAVDRDYDTFIAHLCERCRWRIRRIWRKCSSARPWPAWVWPAGCR